MPSLPSSPATFTWTSTSRAGSARAAAAPTRRPASGSAARSGAMSLTLRLWSAPMKSQVKSSRWRLLLREQLLGAVLPHQLDPGLGQRRQVLGRHVLDGRQDLHLGGRPARAPARGSPRGRRSGSHRAPPVPPAGRSRRRRGGGRSRGPRGSSCSAPGARPRVTPAARELAGDDRAQVEHAAVGHAVEVRRRPPAPRARPRSSSPRCPGPTAAAGRRSKRGHRLAR